MKPLDALLILVCLLFSTGVIVDRRWADERAQHRMWVEFQQEALDLVERRLQTFEQKNGRFPTMAEGLSVVPKLRDDLMKGKFAPAQAFLRQFDDVRTIQGIPYVYENRREAQKGAFDASPQSQDRKKNPRFSRKIADGVVVSSLGLMSDSQAAFGPMWVDALLILAGGIVLLVTLGYAIARNRRSTDRVRGVNAMIILGVAVLLTILIVVTNVTSSTRTKSFERLGAVGVLRQDLLEDYLALRQKFVADGGLDAALAAQEAETLRAEFARLAGR
ncbi:MAG: hypothetical protein JNL94_07240 [Planctomycetes bacterium]|nr:hypothetical protein [Planctomycetota bacterium]